MTCLGDSPAMLKFFLLVATDDDGRDWGVATDDGRDCNATSSEYLKVLFYLQKLICHPSLLEETNYDMTSQIVHIILDYPWTAAVLSNKVSHLHYISAKFWIYVYVCHYKYKLIYLMLFIKIRDIVSGSITAIWWSTPDAYCVYRLKHHSLESHLFNTDHIIYKTHILRILLTIILLTRLVVLKTKCVLEFWNVLCVPYLLHSVYTTVCFQQVLLKHISIQ